MSSIWNTAERLLLGSSTQQPTTSNTSNLDTTVTKSKLDSSIVASNITDNSQSRRETSSPNQNVANATELSTITGWWKGSGGKSRGSNLPAAVAECLARQKARQQLLYKHKYKRIRRVIKEMVLENTALCDVVSEVQQQVLLAAEERRFLLRKLSQYQVTTDQTHQLHQTKAGTNVVQISDAIASVGDVSRSAVSSSGSVSRSVVSSTGGNRSSNSNNRSTGNSTSNSSRNIGSSTNNSNRNNKQIIKKKADSNQEDKSKWKKSRSSKPKRLCPPITLDSAGRPIFPIALGPLTIHSLGEIVSEREAYHEENVIYPVGFCSSRTYASLADPRQSALYTCKVLDGGNAPRFEIVCEEEEESIFTSNSPAECHGRILQSINYALGMDLLSIKSDQPETNERGLRFFGLSHPSVQNVLQACHGARKCSKYKWVRFEVCRSEVEVNSVVDAEREATLCHEALLRNIRFARHHVPTT